MRKQQIVKTKFDVVCVEDRMTSDNKLLFCPEVWQIVKVSAVIVEDGKIEGYQLAGFPATEYWPALCFRRVTYA